MLSLNVNKGVLHFMANEDVVVVILFIGQHVKTETLHYNCNTMDSGNSGWRCQLK